MTNKSTIHVNEVETLNKHGAQVKVFASPLTVGTSKLIMGSAVLRPQEEIYEHVHDYGEEIVYVTHGFGKAYLDGKLIDISAGKVFIARQGVRHKIFNHADVDLRLIFACAPLAPSAKQGHRNTETSNRVKEHNNV